MVAIDVAAEKATELPKLGRPRMKLSAHTSQTGVKVRERPQSIGKKIVNERTGTDRRTPPMVHLVQELGAWDRAVAAKGVHHPRIRCYGKNPVHQATTKRQREHR